MLKSKVNRNGERFVYQDKPEGEEVFKAEVYFNRGGINYWNYKTEPQGVYFSISAVKVEHRNGMVIESFMMGQNKGLKTLILPLERKSAKKVATMAGLLSPHVVELVELFKTDQSAAFAKVRELVGMPALVAAQ